MKKLVSVIVFIVLLIVMSTTSLASGAYIIKNYDVDVVVHLDNSYHITEKILVDHASESHGIIRNIQQKGITTYLINGDWIDKKYSHKVENINISGHKFKASNSGDYKSIKIGDKAEYVSGEVEYLISYDYIIGDDKVTEFDEFYFNLIGTEWDAMIESASFKITMPTNIEEYYINFTAGSFGSEESDAILYSVSGDTITATLNQPLYQYEGVTVRVEMPEGYYTEIVQTFSMWDYFYPIALGILLLLSVALFLMYGKGRKPVPVVTFNPPDGLNSAEIGYILDGIADDKDIISLILYWASTGKLRFEIDDDDEITLVKLSGISKKADSYKRDMYNALFKSGDSIKLSELKNFGDVVESTKIGVRNHFEYKSKNSIYTASSKTVSNLIKVLSILPVFLCVLKLGIDKPLDIELNLILIGGFLFAIGLSFLMFRISNTITQWNTLTKKQRTARMILWILAAFIASIIFIFVIILAFGEIAMVLLAILSLILMTYLSTKCKRMTDHGYKLVNETLGFREFINLAEKDRLNELVQQDPQYFYSILPYAYVLGVSDKWCKKFESINVAPSKWIIFGSDTYAWDALYYQRLLRQSMNTVEHTMSQRSRPVYRGGSSSGGSSYGGGGYTGGGAGGGGGTTW